MITLDKIRAIRNQISETEKKSHYNKIVNHITVFVKIMSFFSAKQSDNSSEISNSKIW